MENVNSPTSLSREPYRGLGGHLTSTTEIIDVSF